MEAKGSKSTRKRPRFGRVIVIQDSSWVGVIAYARNAAVLDMTLNTGRRYRYYDVSPDTFTDVVTATSVGAAVNEHLKPGHNYRSLPAVSKLVPAGAAHGIAAKAA